MSRRRAGDIDEHFENNDLPTALSDSDIKARSPSERIGRYLRTRPCTSFVIVITLITLSMITFFIGRMVGTLVISSFQQKNHNNSSQSPSKAANIDGIARKFEQDASRQHSTGTPAQENDILLNDEHGPLLDGVDAQEMSQPPAKELNANSERMNQSSSQKNSCYRKFEPGKLGWPKMLCITDEYYFDISIASTPVGRFKIGVFGDVVPRSAANFRALATCTGAFKSETLCFRGDGFHRIVRNFVIQGGSKATGRSIYGPTFKEESSPDHHSFLQHGEKGVVSWAEYPIGSQFFILVTDEAKYLDNNHVVFGIITDGFHVLDKILETTKRGEEPIGRVVITDCGDVHKTA